MSAIVQFVTLISKDGEKYQVPLNVVSPLSKLVNELLIESREDDDEFAVPETNSVTLARIIEFCHHQKDNPLGDIPKPIKSQNIKEAVPDWFGNFIEGDGESRLPLTQDELFELLLGANFMQIDPLIELCSASVVARYIFGKKRPEEIAAAFHLPGEYKLTPDQEKLLRKQNPWVDKSDEAQA